MPRLVARAVPTAAEIHQSTQGKDRVMLRTSLHTSPTALTNQPTADKPAWHM